MGKKREMDIGKSFAELIGIMERLRGEEGCPWDREQTHHSLKPFLVEETYEFLEAVDGENPEEMVEELGDLLLQIVFHCQIASEQRRFDAAQVISVLKKKLIRRHPHVFSNRHLPDAQSVLRHWVKAKAQEREMEESPASLGNLPKGMPALTRAQRVGDRASHLGFDWPEIRPVWDKVEEELGELHRAVASGAKRRVAAEVGDLLFTLVNLCRFLDVEAEEALRESLDRFMDRFEYTQDQIRHQGKTLGEISLEDMDVIWEEAKKKTAASPSRSRGGKRKAPAGQKRAIRKHPTKS